MEKEKQLEENKQVKWIKGLAWNKSKMEMLLGIIVIIAILILLFSSSFTGSSADSSTLSSSYNYQSETQRLEEILKQIRGVGEVKVMITYDTSGTEETPTSVFSDTTTINSQTTRPEVIGVVIVAENAGDIEVQMDLIRAAQTALGISADRVEVFDMDSKEGEK